MADKFTAGEPFDGEEGLKTGLQLENLIRLATFAVNSEALDQVTLDDDGAGKARIKDLGVTNAKLGPDAVDGTKIEDDAVSSEHIAESSIGIYHMADSMRFASASRFATDARAISIPLSYAADGGTPFNGGGGEPNVQIPVVTNELILVLGNINCTASALGYIGGDIRMREFGGPYCTSVMAIGDSKSISTAFYLGDGRETFQPWALFKATGDGPAKFMPYLYPIQGGTETGTASYCALLAVKLHVAGLAIGY